MEIKEFIKTAIRRCEWVDADCSNCCFKGKADFCMDESYADVPLEELEKATHAIEEWAKEHPAKTRKNEFLKMFPKARFEDGYSAMCPGFFDKTWKCYRGANCKGCRKDFWNQEV